MSIGDRMLPPSVTPESMREALDWALISRQKEVASGRNAISYGELIDDPIYRALSAMAPVVDEIERRTSDRLDSLSIGV